MKFFTWLAEKSDRTASKAWADFSLLVFFSFVVWLGCLLSSTDITLWKMLWCAFLWLVSDAFMVWLRKRGAEAKRKERLNGLNW